MGAILRVHGPAASGKAPRSRRLSRAFGRPNPSAKTSGAVRSANARQIVHDARGATRGALLGPRAADEVRDGVVPQPDVLLRVPARGVLSATSERGDAAARGLGVAGGARVELQRASAQTE